jgi:hypothetical protein
MVDDTVIVMRANTYRRNSPAKVYTTGNNFEVMVTVTGIEYTYSLFLESRVARGNIGGFTRDYFVFSSLMYWPPDTIVK